MAFIYTLKTIKNWQLLVLLLIFLITSGCDPFTCKKNPGEPESNDENGTVSVQHIARWDGSKWNSLGSGMSSVEGLQTRVNQVLVDGTMIYAGGFFDFAGGRELNSIAFWNGQEWRGFGPPQLPGVHAGYNSDGAIAGEVHAILPGGGETGGLYVGGQFSSVGEFVETSNIALFRFDTMGWQRVGGGVNGPVYALAETYNHYIYVGGAFSQADTVSATSGIARWNFLTHEWSSVGGGIDAASEEIDCLARDGNIIYAGGNFFSIGGVTAANIARWDGSTWSALGNGPGGTVNYIAIINGDIYVAGKFFDETGSAMFASWNGEVWRLIGDHYQHGTGYENIGRTIIAQNDLFFLGGSFNQMDGKTVNNVVSWSGENWSALNGGLFQDNVELVAQVNSLASTGGSLYAGGSFTKTAGSQ